MDWKQLWEILSAPDNVPIIAMIPLLAFYIYLAWKQAHANDLLIAAHALALGHTIVTDNEREFSRVPDLRIDNWLR